MPINYRELRNIVKDISTLGCTVMASGQVLEITKELITTRQELNRLRPVVEAMLKDMQHPYLEVETIGFCTGCENFIDHSMCHCGDMIDRHTIGDGHSPVPSGCSCGYDKT